MNYLLTIVFVSLVALFLFRYEFEVSPHRYDDGLMVYKYDRWTGTMQSCVRMSPEGKPTTTQCFVIGE